VRLDRSAALDEGILDIDKVGFFHVGCSSSPIKSLGERLEAAREHLSDCLIVLPEAFNYWPYSRENGSLDTSIKNCLRELSDRFNVAFVAGTDRKQRWRKTRIQHRWLDRRRVVSRSVTQDRKRTG